MMLIKHISKNNILVYNNKSKDKNTEYYATLAYIVLHVEFLPSPTYFYLLYPLYIILLVHVFPSTYFYMLYLSQFSYIFLHVIPVINKCDSYTPTIKMY